MQIHTLQNPNWRSSAEEGLQHLFGSALGSRQRHLLGLANATGVNLRSLKQTLKATPVSATKANASFASHSARKDEVKGIGRAESLHYMSIHDPL